MKGITGPYETGRLMKKSIEITLFQLKQKQKEE